MLSKKCAHCAFASHVAIHIDTRKVLGAEIIVKGLRRYRTTEWKGIFHRVLRLGSGKGELRHGTPAQIFYLSWQWTKIIQVNAPVLRSQPSHEMLCQENPFLLPQQDIMRIKWFLKYSLTWLKSLCSKSWTQEQNFTIVHVKAMHRLEPRLLPF